MRRLAILLAGAALLAGCAAPAVPEAASAVQAVSSEAGTGHAGSRTEQLAVLDGLVDFGAEIACLRQAAENCGGVKAPRPTPDDTVRCRAACPHAAAVIAPFFRSPPR